MFELAGLSTFLDIFQKAFGLIEKRKDQKRRLFTDIIDPIYTELTVVVGEYYKFLRGCRDEFSQADMSEWEKILSEKRKQREEIILARNKVLGITSSFTTRISSPGNKDLPKVDKLLSEFAVVIEKFFYFSDCRPDLSAASSLFKYIDKVLAARNMPSKEGDSFYIEDLELKKHVMKDLEYSIGNMEWAWKDISVVYGDLRVYCLS